MKMTGCTNLYRSVEDAQKELVAYFDTLHCAPGEHIADIGASGAHLPGWLSLFCRDVDITLEDIDTLCLRQRQVASVMNYYAGLSGRQPEDITTHIVIGNDSSTTLPSTTFQKIFLINTYHEITKPAAMAAELARITAPGGTLYVMEVTSSTVSVRRKDCPHNVSVESELLARFTGAGFRHLKTRVASREKLRGVKVQVACYHFIRA